MHEYTKRPKLVPTPKQQDLRFPGHPEMALLNHPVALPCGKKSSVIVGKNLRSDGAITQVRGAHVDALCADFRMNPGRRRQPRGKWLR